MSWKPQPCLRCNESPKEPGRGKKFCEPCGLLAKEELKERTRKSLAAYKRRQREMERLAGRPDGRAGRTIRKDKGVKKGPRVVHAPGMKQCLGCDRVLTFKQIGTKPDGMPHSRCRPCRTEYAYIYNLKRSFGMTPEQYLELFEAQGQACYICRRHPRNQRLAVDHDHTTGVVRGLLCKKCNRDILGHVGDSPEVLRRAAEYLEVPPAPGVIGVVVVPYHVPKVAGSDD